MARRKTPEPVIKPTEFKSIEQIDRGIKKFKRLIDKVNALDPNTTPYDDQSVRNVEADLHNALMDVFGPTSPMFRRFQHPEIWHGGHNMGDTIYDCQRKFAEGIPQNVKMLEGLITHLEEQKEDFIPPEPERPEPKRARSSQSTVNINAPVERLALGDINEQTVTAVAILETIADALEKDVAIPESERATLATRLRELANNPYIVNVGSQAIIAMIKSLTGG